MITNEEKIKIYNKLVNKFKECVENKADDIVDMEYDDEGHEVWYTRGQKREYAIDDILLTRAMDIDFMEQMIWYFAKTIYGIDDCCKNEFLERE